MALSKQSLFDIALTTIRVQGGPAILFGNCAYRGENDRRCAIGAAIPDAMYRHSMHHAGSVGGLLAAHPEVAGLFEPDVLAFGPEWDDAGREIYQEKPFATQLQSVHDNAALDSTQFGTSQEVRTDEEFFARWEPAMAALAAKHGLTYAAP